MSKKIAPKAQPVAPPPPPRRSRGLIALIVVAVAAIGSFAYMSVGRSESDQQASFQWDRLITGTEPAVALARELAADASRYLELDLAFRPVVI